MSSWAIRVLLLSCILLFVLLMKAKTAIPRGESRSSETASQALSNNASPSELFENGKPGPWGKLEYVRINLEAPDAFIPIETRTDEKPHWYFRSHSPAELAEFFNHCDLTAAQRNELMNTNSWVIESDGLEVMPGEELVLGLSREARTKIYTLLSTDPRNQYNVWPFRFRDGRMDEWFEQSGLSRTTLDLVQSLLYARGSTLCFSDFQLVMSRIPSNDERRRLMKTLTRTAALLVKLRVDADADTEALSDYWAKGRRAKDIETLLDSLARVQGGASVDVIHLLPPFARKRLNTFSVPSDDPAAGARDCYWTAMNFFHDPPDDRFMESDNVRNALAQSYTRVAQPTFGDLMFLASPQGESVHAVVYIADDVVFTKNGATGLQPWILMKWDDLIAGFPGADSLNVLIFHPIQAME